MLLINSHDEKGKYDDKLTYYHMVEMIKSYGRAKASVLLCYKNAQDEIGSLRVPPVSDNTQYYIYKMSDTKDWNEIKEVISQAKKMKIRAVIMYRPDITYEDSRKIEELEKDIRIILPYVHD